MEVIRSQYTLRSRPAPGRAAPAARPAPRHATPARPRRAAPPRRRAARISHRAGQRGDRRELAAVLAPQQECESAEVKAADGEFAGGEAIGQRPLRREQVTDRDRALLPQLADFLVGEDARSRPREDLAAVHFDVPAGAGVMPRTDRQSMQIGQVRPAAEGSAEVAGESANVVAAAHDDAQAALAREVVAEPLRLVQVDARGREIDLLAAVRLDVRALAADALVARRRRDLLLPAQKRFQRGVEALRRVRHGGLTLKDGLAGRVAVVGLDAPADGRLVHLGGIVQVIEELRRRLDEDQQQPVGERIERAAVADFSVCRGSQRLQDRETASVRPVCAGGGCRASSFHIGDPRNPATRATRDTSGKPAKIGSISPFRGFWALLSPRGTDMLRERGTSRPLYRNLSMRSPKPTRSTRSRKTVANDTLDLDQLLRVLMSVKHGEFSARMPANKVGLAGKIADTLNDVIDLNQRLTAELDRLSTVVGKEGRIAQRASLGGASGAWAACVESMNSLVTDLVQPTTEVARVIGAVAKGDLSQTMALEIDGRPLTGEFLRTARTVNTMVEQLNAFASEVTRVASEVGTDGKLGGQAQVPGVSGTWKDLTDNVNFMASNLTNQVRNIAAVTTAVANGDLSKKITADAKGEILELKDTINTMVDQLGAFASEVTRVAREVGHRRQARRAGGGARRLRHLEGPHRQRQLDGQQPHRARCATSPTSPRPSPTATCRRRSPPTPRARSSS